MPHCREKRYSEPEVMVSQVVDRVAVEAVVNSEFGVADIADIPAGAGRFGAAMKG